ncbi:MAG: hypothetical protein N2746_04790 [Deltaproteobacteria bacterium]|nr:hypothetical protein [Deltaproteobacteria bacterium]
MIKDILIKLREIFFNFFSKLREIHIINSDQDNLGESEYDDVSKFKQELREILGVDCIDEKKLLSEIIIINNEADATLNFDDPKERKNIKRVRNLLSDLNSLYRLLRLTSIDHKSVKSLLEKLVIPREDTNKILDDLENEIKNMKKSLKRDYESYLRSNDSLAQIDKNNLYAYILVLSIIDLGIDLLGLPDKTWKVSEAKRTALEKLIPILKSLLASRIEEYELKVIELYCHYLTFFTSLPYLILSKNYNKIVEKIFIKSVSSTITLIYKIFNKSFKDIHELFVKTETTEIQSDKKPMLLLFFIPYPTINLDISGFSHLFKYESYLSPKFAYYLPTDIIGYNKYEIGLSTYNNLNFLKATKNSKGIMSEEIYFMTKKPKDGTYMTNIYKLTIDKEIKLSNILELSEINPIVAIPFYEDTQCQFMILENMDKSVNIYKYSQNKCELVSSIEDFRYLAHIEGERPFIIVRPINESLPSYGQEPMIGKSNYKGFFVNSPHQMINIPKVTFLGSYYGIDRSGNIKLAVASKYEKFIKIFTIDINSNSIIEEEIKLGDDVFEVEKIFFDQDNCYIFCWKADRDRFHNLMCMKYSDNSLSDPVLIARKFPDTRRTYISLKISDVVVGENIVILLEESETSYDSDYNSLGSSKRMFVYLFDQNLQKLAEFKLGQPETVDLCLGNYMIYRDIGLKRVVIMFFAK